MAHVDLRPFDDDDADAVFEMMSDPDAAAQAAFTADDPGDRDAFDVWLERHRADDRVRMFVVTEDGGFAGTAAAFTVDDDREVTFWIARHARGRGVASAALRLLIAREAERPLYARVAADNAASLAVLQANGFSEIERARSFAPARGTEIDEVILVLPPTLDGI
ncbi:GNAT family N-acetyltransferase [Microbacterium radiodurans]|uniref:GNAT family N-acetyltransferase n=1 Tax=Microbacterium radiodurans TaxID=661398 RepID=A0A5J5IXI9_9MICO|nr:GNAT family N-acetyltransferase [Microbacterium radiodurans]KAA9089280.1 GNAT family N-acetyltransferase [Microbacterium radiodurans]